MKRVVCLLVIVSIAYAGCADKKPSKVTVVSLPPIWYTPGDWESNAVLRLKNARLEMELSEVKNMHKQNKASPFRIDELEAALESQRAVSRAILAKWERELSKAKIMHKQNEDLLVRIAELESQRVASRAYIAKLQGELREAKIMHKQNKTLLVRIAKLEAVTESQSAVIKSSKNIHRLHEVALGYQRVALDSLLNLCRLYEAKIESQRAEMELFL